MRDVYHEGVTVIVNFSEKGFVITYTIDYVILLTYISGDYADR